jgi:uncharacterized membrane protein YphA (DoxX/SURF4 family)
VIRAAAAPANLVTGPRTYQGSGGDKLQRFFSTFPAGKPGAGLLILRISLGITILLHSGVYLTGAAGHSGWTVIAGPAGIAGSLLLLIGFLTPLVSVSVCLGAIFASLSHLQSPTDMHNIDLSAICCILVAAALAFLGPGAFSLDARMFGRREIIIPDIDHR